MLTWKYRLEWLQEFLKELATEEDAEHPLGEMADGMDYHWYHRDKQLSTAKDTDYVDVLHIAHLVDEINRIRDAFDDVGLFDARLSVFESGISTKDAMRIRPKSEACATDDIEIPAYAIDPDSDDPKVTQADAFQAQEVIRRTLGALSGGVATAGWHSWMSSSHGNFINMGLRLDDAEEVKEPIDAIQRASWYSFKRIQHTVGDAVSAQLLLPDVSGFSTGETGLDEWEPSDWDDALVFEFIMPAGRATCGEIKRYVYVMMADPWRGEVKSLCVEYNPSVAGQLVFRHQIFPSQLSDPEPGGDDGDLQIRSGDFADAESFTVSGTVTQILTTGLSPVLLSSDSRLVDFRAIDCPISDEIVELDVDEFEVILL